MTIWPMTNDGDLTVDSKGDLYVQDTLEANGSNIIFSIGSKLNTSQWSCDYCQTVNTKERCIECGAPHIGEER